MASPAPHQHDRAPDALTRNNRLVLEALAASPRPLSAYDLLDRLRPEGLRAPPQIYRALKWLGEHGLVHKLESANAYVACAHASCCGGAQCRASGTVFLLCERCGGAQEVAAPQVAADLEAMAGALGFAARDAAVEVHGVCADCRAA